MTVAPSDPARAYAPDGDIEHPPLAPLLEILARLEARSLPHALGASGLLAALGLVSVVNDWDITVAAPVATLVEVCSGLQFEYSGNSGCHADHKLAFERERVELIAGFAFFVPSGVVRIPTVITGTWQGIPVGSPTAWAVAYALMGEAENSPRRRARAESLFDVLSRGPAEPAVLDTLLAQPLPDVVARRLRAESIASPSFAREHIQCERRDPVEDQHPVQVVDLVEDDAGREVRGLEM